MDEISPYISQICNEFNIAMVNSKFRSDFEKEGYEVEDLLNLERWHSLNLVATSKGKKAFITHLPDELKPPN